MNAGGRSSERAWSRPWMLAAARPLLITYLLILVALLRRPPPSLETRAAAWTSGAGEAGEHRDLCLGTAQRIGPGQPPFGRTATIFQPNSAPVYTNDVR
jgi:hypothetical protein